MAVKLLRSRFFASNVYNTAVRNSTITAIFLDKTVRVYNGSKLKSFFIRPAMLGKKLGEFSITKVLGRDIYFSKQQKAKKKKKK